MERCARATHRPRKPAAASPGEGRVWGRAARSTRTALGRTRRTRRHVWACSLLRTWRVLQWRGGRSSRYWHPCSAQRGRPPPVAVAAKAAAGNEVAGVRGAAIECSTTPAAVDQCALQVTAAAAARAVMATMAAAWTVQAAVAAMAAMASQAVSSRSCGSALRCGQHRALATHAHGRRGI